VSHPWRRTARFRAALAAAPLPRKAPAQSSGRCGREPPAALLKGIEEFNRQEYFEAHETLEAIWLAERDPIRSLYQGILMVGVGFYHWRRGNWRGAVGKLRGGCDKLAPFRPTCLSIDVERLVQEAWALREELERLGRHQLPPFPPPGLPLVHRITAAP